MLKDKITPATLPVGDVLVYEYGVHLDRKSVKLVDDQVKKARALYNNCIEVIRRAVDGANQYTLERAGQSAQDAYADVQRINEESATAKAANDEPAMKEIAQRRRLAWSTLSALLKDTREAIKNDLQRQFYSKIGNNSSCETYQLRCKAVSSGLGWATANKILSDALAAFKKTIQHGQAPKFAKSSEKIQDCLILQFASIAGGLTALELLAGKNKEIKLTAPEGGAGRRRYGEFAFRIGSAKANTYATGTWKFHRPFPPDARVGIARLVRSFIGKDTRWTLQLQVSFTPETAHSEKRKRLPLAAVHFGWSNSQEGLRIAAIADSAEPTSASIVTLPVSIETGLKTSSVTQAERDETIKEIIPFIKEFITIPEDAHDEVREIWKRFIRTKVEYVSQRNLHYLIISLKSYGILIPEKVEIWRKGDRLDLQKQTHVAKRARNARKTFYREIALRLAQTYDAIAIEPLDLTGAAKKVNEVTGEKTEFAKKARANRVMAAIYEFESAIRHAAVKNDCAVIEVAAETVSNCALCGGEIMADEEDSQLLHCSSCGAELDRKQNGAAVAWQVVNEELETVVADYWVARNKKGAEDREARAERQRKLQEGRKAARKARTESDEKTPEGSQSK